MTDPRRAGDPAPTSPTSSDFVERVMSCVASSPPPSAPRSFVTAARERSFHDARGSLAVAWHLALRSRVPALVRMQALSLVAVVALSVGAVSVAASAAAYRVAAPLVASVIAQDAPDERSLPAPRPATPSASPWVDASPALDARPATEGPGSDDGDGDAGRSVVRSGSTAATGDEEDDLGDDDADQEGADPEDAEDPDAPDADEEDPSDDEDPEDAEDPADAEDPDAPDADEEDPSDD